MKKIIQVIQSKALAILIGITLSMGVSLAYVGWQYKESISTIETLRADKVTLSGRLESCSEELLLARNIRTDLEGSFGAVLEEKQESQDQFSSLKQELDKLANTRAKQCPIPKGNQNEETSQAITDHDPVVDDYYRLLYRAHCLSRGAGSCESTGDVLQ